MKPEYAFVDDFGSLGQLVRGKGARERFDFWHTQFRYLRAMAKVCCTMGEQDRRMQALAKTDPLARSEAFEAAVEIRRELQSNWAEMVTLLLETVNTPGGMGNVANLELRSRIAMNKLQRHDQALEKTLGTKLPADLQLPEHYAGRPRLIVPTVRTSAKQGEALKLHIIVLDKMPPALAELYWRPMGHGEWRTLPLQHVGQAVYEVTLPPAGDESLEYYIGAKTAEGKTLRWPATAPELNQTVVVM